MPSPLFFQATASRHSLQDRSLAGKLPQCLSTPPPPPQRKHQREIHTKNNINIKEHSVYDSPYMTFKKNQTITMVLKSESSSLAWGVKSRGTMDWKGAKEDFLWWWKCTWFVLGIGYITTQNDPNTSTNTLDLYILIHVNYAPIFKNF